MRVTRFYLWRKGACKKNRRLFKKTFGWSAEVNIENYRKALAVGLGVYYFTVFLSKGRIRCEMRSLYEQYVREMDYK